MAVKRLLCSFLLIASPLLTSSFAGGFGAPVIRRQQQRYQHQHQQHRRHLQPLRMMSDWGLPPPPPPKSSLLGLGKAVLGVDYGTRRVGVGVSAGLVPRPLTVLKHGGNDTAVGLQLLRLARGEMADLIVCDASFIGLEKVLPASLALAKPRAKLIALIKPQFQAGRKDVGKGGVVRDAAIHQRVCDEVCAWLEETGWRPSGITESPIKGPKGNTEFLAFAQRNTD